MKTKAKLPTSRQLEYHRFMMRYQAANQGQAPTIREICEATGTRGTSGTVQVLERLMTYGLVVRGPRRSYVAVGRE